MNLLGSIYNAPKIHVGQNLRITPSVVNPIINHCGASYEEVIKDEGGLGCPCILSEIDDRYLARLVQIKKHSIVLQC